MKRSLDTSAFRRRLIRIGIIFLSLGVFCGVSLVIGWIHANWDPNFLVDTRRGGMPIWLMTIWIGTFGTFLCWFGVSQLRDAALLWKDDNTSDEPHNQNGEFE